MAGPAGVHVVEVQDVGVQYDLRFTRRTTVRGLFTSLLSRPAPRRPFWALRHVSFAVAHGESLAIIGPNGAGKSTLLLTLAGIIQPSEGRLHVRGEISALLALGVGFAPELSGRENIGLAGAFLGIDHRLMGELTETIVEFSDLGAFIDAPLKSYSTGMRARLGFAIATAVRPDVLLLDEVLATGDQGFRAKALVRIRDLLASARAVVVVTHDLSFVTDSCSRALLLDGGGVVAQGEPLEVVGAYRERIAAQRGLRPGAAVVPAAHAPDAGAGGPGASRA